MKNSCLRKAADYAEARRSRQGRVPAELGKGVGRSVGHDPYKDYIYLNIRRTNHKIIRYLSAT